MDRASGTSRKITNSIYIFGDPEEKEELLEKRKIIEFLMAEKFPNLAKDINQIQEIQQTSSRISLNKSTPTHITVILLETIGKKILESFKTTIGS